MKNVYLNGIGSGKNCFLKFTFEESFEFKGSGSKIGAVSFWLETGGAEGYEAKRKQDFFHAAKIPLFV